MRTVSTLATLALAGAGLLACTPLSTQPASGMTARADHAYHAARNHHLARRYDAARVAYHIALGADPAHVDARNGLAALHAEQRDFAAGIKIWRELTTPLTLSSGPGKAYLFINLGHAYFLSGDYDNALAALEKACLLDPLNHRSWQLLGDTLRKLGQDVRAEQMHRQAAALRQHDFRADFVVAVGKTDVAAIGQAVRARPVDDPAWLETILHVGEDGMLELRRGGKAPVAVTVQSERELPAPQTESTRAMAKVRLEIRNGNGVPGMARALARRLGEPGVQVTRLSNDRGFAVRRTRIEYEPAYRAAAERLARRLGRVQLREVRECAPADMRLVLGRDLPRRGVTLRPRSTPGLPASFTSLRPSSGYRF